MKNYRKLLVCLPLFGLPFLMSEINDEASPSFPQNFHTEKEMAAFNLMLSDTLLPELTNQLFAGSGVCAKCHDFDTLGVASVDVSGEDVNLISDWRATMMANAAKDPFWRAEVSNEVLLHPQHKAAIEDKCITCHAPLGHFNAKHIGMEHYGMADLEADELAKDGVSCLACHQMSADSLGFLFSGNVKYDTFKVAYGPYQFPLVSPMLTETGYKPVFSEHISDAGICAGCHSLITETIDYDGEFTGGTFVEQATYHEWLNSVYGDSVSCQSCHMPNLDKWPVFLVTGAMTDARSPFYLHELVGGNVTMLKLLRDNIEQLGIKASVDQFNEVIEKTENMLKDRSIELELELKDRTADTARFELKLSNLAGHKFPSGYPSRRAFVEFLVQNEAGDTLFISGKTDDNFEVFGQNDSYEPHYQNINSEQQVQIYEMVMGDVNDEVTTILEKADHPIKDNRLPPIGFTTSHAVYDTTSIAGRARDDIDFNKNNNIEGSGSDAVYYNIPMNGNPGLLLVTAKVFYQSTPPKWMKSLFESSTPEIELFKTLFNETDRSPTLVKEISIIADAITKNREKTGSNDFVTVFPVPTNDGILNIKSEYAHQLKVFSINGQLIKEMEKKKGIYKLQLNNKGVFILFFKNISHAGPYGRAGRQEKGQVQIERVING
ncbi:MAG TPA: hypothetical protein ENJ95_06675 [Bacteroidetes bacterium]|nr:hypothetical protein [Bacteroidota bacterium]